MEQKNHNYIPHVFIGSIVSIILLGHVAHRAISLDPDMFSAAESSTTHTPSRRVYARAYKIATSAQKQDFFNKLGLIYAPVPVFRPGCEALAHVQREDLLSYANDPARYEARTQKYGPLLAKHYVTPNYIQWINNFIGYGAFASEDLPAGTLIGEYTGEIMRKTPTTVWSWKFESFKAPLPKKSSITSHKHANELRFINHSDRPNIKMEYVFHNHQWHLCYIATKPIQKGEQLLVSYGKKYWKKRQKQLLTP